MNDVKAASVIENLHRNKMNTKDMTSACVFLSGSVGKNKAVLSLGISQQTLKKYLGFAAVPDKLKEISNENSLVMMLQNYIKLFQMYQKQYEL